MDSGCTDWDTATSCGANQSCSGGQCVISQGPDQVSTCTGSALTSSAAWTMLNARADTLRNITPTSVVNRRYLRRCDTSGCGAWTQGATFANLDMRLGSASLPPSWLLVGGTFEVDSSGAGGDYGRHLWLDGEVSFSGASPTAKAAYSYWGTSDTASQYPLGSNATITRNDVSQNGARLDRDWFYSATVLITQGCVDVRATVPWVSTNPGDAIPYTRIVGEMVLIWHAEL